MRFNVTGVPTGAEITAAELRLVGNNPGYGGTLRLFMTDNPDWDEMDLTWSNPLTGNDASADLHTFTSVEKYVTNRVVGLEHIIIGNNSYTFVIRSNNPDAASYYSSEYTRADFSPKLAVTYVVP